MDVDKKISYLEDEIIAIKREGTRVSDDTRKAIIHDVAEKSKEGRYKVLTVGFTAMMVFVSLIAYVGFGAIENSTAEYVGKSEIKKQILNELSEERVASDKVLNEVKVLTHQLQMERKKLIELVSELLVEVENKQRSLERVSNVIAKLGIANKDIESIIEPELLDVLRKSNAFVFLKSFGISEISVIKLLANETENFNFHNITKATLSDNVKQIQERYELTVDGNLGPCTSLVIGALLFEHYEMETRSELKNSSYGSEKWLSNSFQTCSQKDKSQIQRYLDFSDLPLHVQLNTFVTATGMKRESLMTNLIKHMPTPNAYEALNYIGYEQP